MDIFEATKQTFRLDNWKTCFVSKFDNTTKHGTIQFQRIMKFNRLAKCTFLLGESEDTIMARANINWKD